MKQVFLCARRCLPPSAPPLSKNNPASFQLATAYITAAGAGVEFTVLEITW
ncbi:MAG: hypothetical protein ISR56_10860 [Bacteroidales bacterium]|nr:hypothetical protein [Bacteroidales bacterium]